MFKIANIFLLFSFLLSSKQCFSKNIALCVVATGNQAQSMKKLIESARKNFLPENNLTFFIFTNQILPINGDDIQIIPWPDKPEPYASLTRFKAFSTIQAALDENDYVYACDPNIEFIDKIGDEVLGNLVGAVHKRQENADKQYKGILLEENNNESALWIDPSLVINWHEEFACEFYGGTRDEFKKLINECSETATQDLKNKIFLNQQYAKHLNHFFWHNLPDIKLLIDCHDLNDFENNKNKGYIGTKIVCHKKTTTTKNKINWNDRDFVILIPSYNNIKNYKSNLDSVYKQNYDKYRVIYVDDNSPDGTGEAVEKYVHELGKAAITTIIKNDERKLAMANIYHAIHQHCYDHEIVVMLDGDDELAHEEVLSDLNNIYKKGDIWLTYGNLWLKTERATCSWSKKIDGVEIELNRFREWDGSVTALRTFGAWLFKQIKKDDLQVNNSFFKMAYDVAMFMPIIEMAGYHHCFIEKVLYIYNDESPINDHKINRQLQLDLNKYIRESMPKYNQLSGMEYFEKILRPGGYRDCKDKIEISGLLNDFIANIVSIYTDIYDVETILNKIDFLRSNLIDKNDLWQIACQYKYSYLKNYLARKKHSSCNCKNRKYYRCKYVLDSEPMPSIKRIKFANWLWDIINNKYNLKSTSLTEDIHRKNAEGYTPLMTAASLGLPDLVEELLDLGADKNVQLANGKKAIDFALNRTEPWCKYIVELLK